MAVVAVGVASSSSQQQEKICQSRKLRVIQPGSGKIQGTWGWTGHFNATTSGLLPKLASKSGFSVASESGSPCAHTLQITTDPPPNPSIENFVNAPYEKLFVGLRSSDLCCPKIPIIGMLFSMFPLAITGYMGSVCNMEYRLQRLEIGNLLNNVDIVCTQRLKIHSDRFDLALIFGPGTTGLLYQRKLRRRRRRRKLPSWQCWRRAIQFSTWCTSMFSNMQVRPEINLHQCNTH